MGDLVLIEALGTWRTGERDSGSGRSPLPRHLQPNVPRLDASTAKELGIERPKVRNGRSVANLNTLIYLIINVRALNHAKSINRGLLHMN